MTQSEASDIRGRLLECFATVFPTATSEEILALDHARSDEWDSLAAISLVTIIEEEFGLVLDDEIIASMTTFRLTETAVTAGVEAL